MDNSETKETLGSFVSAQLVHNLEAIAKPPSDGISSTLEIRSQENGYGCIEKIKRGIDKIRNRKQYTNKIDEL